MVRKIFRKELSHELIKRQIFRRSETIEIKEPDNRQIQKQKPDKQIEIQTDRI